MSDETEVVLMDFPDAMRAVQDGLTVKRMTWDDKDAMVGLRFGQMQIRISKTWRPWLISDEDVKAKDWAV